MGKFLYLVCEKDSENVSEQMVSVMTVEEIDKRTEELRALYDDLSITLDDSTGRVLARMDFSDKFGDDFYVVEIYSLKEEDLSKEYVFVWNHGYDGVGFEIDFGTFSDMENVSKSYLENALSYEDCVHYFDDNNLEGWTLDIGNEWNHAEIYSMSDLMKKAER